MTPEQHKAAFEAHWYATRGNKKATRELRPHALQPQTYIENSANRHWVTWQAAIAIMEATAPITQARKALSGSELSALHDKLGGKPVHPTYNEAKLAKRWSETK